MTRLAILGLGLIGGSIAKAARGHVQSIVAYDPNDLTLAQARKDNAIDEAAASAADAVKNAGIVILAAPLQAYETLAKAIAPALKENALVMDTGSVKQAAIARIAPHIPPARFIPAHPIAGSEKTGYAASSAELLHDKRVILTPDSPETPRVQDAIDFWQGIGVRAEAMPAAIHDQIYAAVSHLPQYLCFALQHILAPHFHLRDKDETFRRFTRLCDSSPEMWQEIFILNHDAIAHSLKLYIEALEQIQSELATSEKNNEPASPELLYGKLLPRILSSCLISSVARQERAAGIPMARFAGTGFADFTAPASGDPESDFARISNNAKEVAEILQNFIDSLSTN